MKLIGTLLFSALIMSAYGQLANEAQAKETTLVIQGSTPTEPWDGWGHSGPPKPDLLPKPEPEIFTPVVGSQTFSGRVEGVASTKGLEVGIVSLVGVHFVDPKYYQWSPVNEDGTFSVTSNAYPEASKSLVLRGPETPWTFFRYDFPPQDGAKDLVFRAKPGKKVRLSIRSEGQSEQTQGYFQFFPETLQVNDAGTPLRRQRIGLADLRGKASTEIWLPLEPVAVLVISKGLANFYHVFDPRAADHFQFNLQKGGILKVQVRDAEGRPVEGVQVGWINPASPLSLENGRTNAEGVLIRETLPPGKVNLDVQGFPSRVIFMESGRETLVELQK